MQSAMDCSLYGSGSYRGNARRHRFYKRQPEPFGRGNEHQRARALHHGGDVAVIDSVQQHYTGKIEFFRLFFQRQIVICDNELVIFADFIGQQGVCV